MENKEEEIGSDLEGYIATSDINKINVLKQVVTDPDYVSREKFFDGASPRQLSIREQRE